MCCGCPNYVERSWRGALSKLKHIARYAGQSLTVFLLAGLLTAADKWPQFRGNPQLTGVTADAVPSTLKPLWTYEAGESIESSAAIADGTVYVGSQSADLLAIDLKTGKLRWKYRAKEGIGESSPAVCDEVFRGIRIADGKEVLEFPSGGYTGASPALVGQSAYYGTFNNEVVDADVRRKRLVWRYEHPDRHFPFYSSAAAAADRIVIGGRDKFVHCLDARTGKAIWTFATGARVDSSPAIAGNRVY